MTSDIIHTYNEQEYAQKSIFGLWQRAPEPSHLTTLLKTAYNRLKKAEIDIAEKNERIAELERILTIDELTGLTNRRGFYTHFEAELDRVNRGQNHGGLLIMIDLDRFKFINDTFGHAAGDEALRIVGSFLQSNIRSMDSAARLGGDEFILLLSNTCIELAMARAKKIGERLNSLSFDWEGTRINLHGSLGLKEFTQGDTIESIIAEADAGMYENKAERTEMIS